MQTVFQLWYYIESENKYPKGHEFTSTVTAHDLESAKAQLSQWFKDNEWETTWLRIKDCKNDIEITL